MVTGTSREFSRPSKRLTDPSEALKQWKPAPSRGNHSRKEPFRARRLGPFLPEGRPKNNFRDFKVAGTGHLARQGRCAVRPRLTHGPSGFCLHADVVAEFNQLQVRCNEQIGAGRYSEAELTILIGSADLSNVVLHSNHGCTRLLHGLGLIANARTSTSSLRPTRNWGPPAATPVRSTAK